MVSAPLSNRSNSKATSRDDVPRRCDHNCFLTEAKVGQNKQHHMGELGGRRAEERGAEGEGGRGGYVGENAPCSDGGA